MSILAEIIVALIVFTAGTFVGALITLKLLPTLDCGGTYTPDDDRPFLDQPIERAALYSVGDETDIVQALRLSDGRPTPGPTLRAVPDA